MIGGLVSHGSWVSWFGVLCMEIMFRNVLRLNNMHRCGGCYHVINLVIISPRYEEFLHKSEPVALLLCHVSIMLVVNFMNLTRITELGVL